MNHVGSDARRGTGGRASGGLPEEAGCWGWRPMTSTGQPCNMPLLNVKYLSSNMKLRQLLRDEDRALERKTLSAKAEQALMPTADSRRIVIDGDQLATPLRASKSSATLRAMMRGSQSSEALHVPGAHEVAEALAPEAQLASCMSSSFAGSLDWRDDGPSTRSLSGLTTPARRPRTGAAAQQYLPIVLPDKLDWVQTALTRSPEHRLRLTGSRLGKPSFNQAASSVPLIGPSSLFVPPASTVGSARTMRVLAKSRSEQRFHRADPRSGAAPSSTAKVGVPETWSTFSFDRMAAHEGGRFSRP